MPEAVKLVVEAPPFALNSPLVMVEEALERKPLVNVARPVCVSVPVCVVLPETVSEPSVASCEKRFVLDAVVENRFVVVAFVMIVFARVEAPVALNVGTCKPVYKKGGGGRAKKKPPPLFFNIYNKF